MPTAQAQIVGGSYGTWNAIAKFGGEEHGVNFSVTANHFATDGYRDHSEARATSSMRSSSSASATARGSR